MPFCPECKSMAYPTGGVLTCKRCGWTADKPTAKKVVTTEAVKQDTVVIDEKVDTRAEQDTECPKCGHGRAKFHLMQTRRSDEPPTEINQCMKCGHSWREY